MDFFSLVLGVGILGLFIWVASTVYEIFFSEEYNPPPREDSKKSSIIKKDKKSIPVKRTSIPRKYVLTSNNNVRIPSNILKERYNILNKYSTGRSDNKVIQSEYITCKFCGYKYPRSAKFCPGCAFGVTQSQKWRRLHQPF